MKLTFKRRNYIVIILMLLATLLASSKALATSATDETTRHLTTSIALDQDERIQFKLISDTNCFPNSGWMWVPGPFMPAVAIEAQKDLSLAGISAIVEARGYGEIDSCDTYSPRGVDFTVTLADPKLENLLSQSEVTAMIAPVLLKHGQPDVGNVKLISTQGEITSLDLRGESPAIQALADELLPENAITKLVYVIVYDPLLANGENLSDFLLWNDHETITQQTIDFFKQASEYQINYSVAYTSVITDGWPVLMDGFSYTEESYLDVLSGEQEHHSPTEVDYNKIVNSPELDICEKLNSGEIDEVWIYNGPWFGFYESTLAGPEAYAYNSPPVSGAHDCNRLLPIMGPSLERTVDEAVHNFGHRTESTMVKVYGSWSQNNISHSWNQFTLVDPLSPDYSYSGCGNIHYPPNGVTDYDYGNLSTVLSNCDDFVNYPNLNDPLTVAQPITCSPWGCLSLDYLGYWFGHLPSNPGCGPDNVANNWWRYFAEPAFALYPPYACQDNTHFISGDTNIGVSSLKYTDGTDKIVNTDIYGNYFLMVSDQWSGIVTPSKYGGYIFDPANRNYTDVQSNFYNQDYTSTFNGPEISITGNNYPIVDGDSAPSLLDHTDFGSIPVIDGSISHTYTIYNTGVGDLSLINSPRVAIAGTHASDFSVTTQPSSPILPSGSTIFTVVFNPSAEGQRSALISIANDDSDENPYNFSVQGEGTTAYYVNIATGDNSNSCTSIAAPCQNIQETVNKASAGDVIYVASGTYLFSTNGTPNVIIINKNITLSGGWNADFTSQNSASTIDGANTNNGILTISGNVIVENFIIQNARSSNSGAIYIVNGNFTLKKSTLRNNTATNNGAGIYLDNGALNIINSTVSGNTANSSGGGIYASNNIGTSVTIQNSTIAHNNASTGGGISRTNGTYNITNTIIANNSSSISSPDCDGTIAMADFNIIENMAGCVITSGNNNLSVDPQVDINLTEDMLVHMLLAGSPAINAGSASGCPPTDQLGIARPQGSSCDIGSIEYIDVLEPTVLTIIRANESPTNAADIDFTVTFSEAVTGVDVTDFTLTADGVIDASLTSVSNSDAVYTVSVNTGSGDGTIRLDLVDNGSIVDMANNSLNGGFTDGEEYVVDTTAPETSIEAQPADPSNDDSPTFEFSSIDDTAIFECQLDSGEYSTCPSPKSYSELSEGEHTFYVRAIDTAGNADTSPASHTWDIDTTAPETSIDAQPASPSNDSSPTFEFSSIDSTATFECQLDSDGYSTCLSPKSYSGLSEGEHTFHVRTIDSAGNADASPASYTWDIDTTAPETSIDTQPADPSNDDSPTFKFSSADNTTTFECQVDSGGYSTCASPKTYSGLSEGQHTFYVRAIDTAGNADASPASYSWNIDTIAPETNIDTQPANPSNDDSPTFEFNSADDTATFECQLDSGGYSTCSSPKAYSGLSEGEHTFYVRAVDETGNIDSSPASYIWNIDTTAPETSIDAQPTDPSNDDSPTFEFSSPDNTAAFECQLDSGEYSTCSSPKTYTGLGEGEHTFYVRAIDTASNADTSAGSYIWAIDTTAPTVVSITRDNAEFTNISVPLLRYTIIFSEEVVGLDETDFTVFTGEGISSGSIVDVFGSGETYSILVAIDIGAGTVRLDLNTANTGIEDFTSNPLGEGFSSDEQYINCTIQGMIFDPPPEKSK